MKIRSLKRLYKILLEKGSHKRINTYGVCYEIEVLTDDEHITVDERNVLDDHFERQRPSEDKYPEFYYHQLNAEVVGKSAYWWPCERQESEEGEYPYEKKAPKNVRIQFIEHLIKTL